MISIWLDLPVRDVEAAKSFFKKIGFRENQGCKDPAFGSFLIGDQDFVMMLSPHSKFKEYADNEVAESKNGTEMLLSLGAESRIEVDAMAARVREAGGKIFSEPNEWEGWMYGFGFEDLDGHRWNVLYMESGEPQ